MWSDDRIGGQPITRSQPGVPRITTRRLLNQGLLARSRLLFPWQNPCAAEPMISSKPVSTTSRQFLDSKRSEAIRSLVMAACRF